MLGEAGDDGALLLLLLDEPNSAAVVARANTITVHALAGEQEIEQALTPVLRGLARQDPLGEGAMQARLEYLSSFLAEPLADLQLAQEVGFVPGPGLELLPLELLPGGASSAAAITRFSISASQPDVGSKAVERGRIVILDPGLIAEQAYSGDWVDLPAVGSEIGQLKSLLDGQPYVHRSGSQAASTLSQLGNGGPLRLLHVAGHAVAHRQWSSLDLLAFGSGPDQQVPLGALRGQRWRVDLVVLSACRTALGGKGESGLSFAQSFLAGGSLQVLASAWSVDDRATAEFMQHFYQAHLRDGAEPVRALQTAQDRMRVQTRWRAPYWWAGFQLWKGLPAQTLAPALAANQRVAVQR
jgi:CHAT domain-containing protein